MADSMVKFKIQGSILHAMNSAKKANKRLLLPLFEVRDDFLDESRGEAGFFSGDESSSAAWCDVT